MRTLVTVVTLVLVAAACSPTTPAGSEPTQPLTAASAAAPGAAATVPATEAAQPSAAPPTAANTGGATPVMLKVLVPQDGDVVNTAQILVSGLASPGAVVTVNDDIVIAGNDGAFQDPVTLTDGLNLIEVIASNTSGSEASVELMVTYEP